MSAHMDKGIAILERRVKDLEDLAESKRRDKLVKIALLEEKLAEVKAMVARRNWR